MSKKMNPEIKARWVAALKSGEYQQGRGQLREGARFCCLGVLCDLYAKERGESWTANRFMECRTLPPSPVDYWACGDYTTLYIEVDIDGERLPLSQHNDAGRTFAQIADAIEEQL